MAGQDRRRLRQLQERYETLHGRLGELGFFRRGSLLQRHTVCGRPGCRCQADPPQPHGPYWQWTRKVRGKTETTRLSNEQAELYREWATNARELDEILRDMEAVSFEATELIMRGKSSP